MILNRQQKWLGFALLAPLFYALKSGAIKFAPPAKTEFFVFARFLFDFLLLAPFFIAFRDKLHSKQLKLHFVRAIFVALSIYCSVYGIRHLSLVDAILLENTLPLFIPIIAWIWYGKKMTTYSFLILILGFCALFFLLKPKLDILHWASLASIGTGLTSAITAVSINRLSQTEHPLAILFYFNLFSGAIALGPCLYTWEGIPPFSFSFWVPFVVISLFGVLFQFAITRAYSLVSPHIAGNFAYFSVLFSALFGWMIWNETLSLWQIIGGGLMVCSGFLMIRENRREEILLTHAPKR